MSRLRLLAVVISLAVGFPAVAQSDTRVYTNADLEALPPMAVDSAPVAANDEASQAFVTEFLQRERERLDAERALRLEERRVSLEERAVDRRLATGGVGLPYYGYPYVGRYGRPGPRRRVVETNVPGAPIVPLHARPSLAMTQRAKAVRLSGVDAFPSNARRGH